MKKVLRCAVYTRKSSDEGLEQEFNSLDAQYEACAAYAISQRHEGWVLLPDRYDDGGFSGGNMQRGGLQRLLADVAAMVERVFGDRPEPEPAGDEPPATLAQAEAAPPDAAPAVELAAPTEESSPVAQTVELSPTRLTESAGSSREPSPAMPEQQPEPGGGTPVRRRHGRAVPQ